MRPAARSHTFAAPPRVEPVGDPAARPGEDEVVVRIQRAAVTHLDRTAATGDSARKPAPPHTGGVEGVRPGGRAVPVGSTAGTDFRLHLPSWLLSDAAILPVNLRRSGRWARGQLEDLAARFAAGAPHLTTGTAGLSGLPRALERLAAGAVTGRLVVDPWR